MRDLATKREEILKSIEEAEKNAAAANPKNEDEPNIKQDRVHRSLHKADNFQSAVYSPL